MEINYNELDDLICLVEIYRKGRDISDSDIRAEIIFDVMGAYYG